MENERTPPPIDLDGPARVAWFHHDAADAFEGLAHRLHLIGDLASVFRLDDLREERLELQRLQRFTCELAGLQFVDLLTEPLPQAQNDWMKKLLMLLMAVGPSLVAGGHFVPGPIGAAMSIVGVAITGLSALNHPTPAAVAAFGSGAK